MSEVYDYSISPSEKKEDWIPIVPEKPSAEQETPEEASSTTPEDDDEGDTAEFVGGIKDTSSTTTSSTTSKDLTKEINIIQELLPPGVVHQVKVDSSNDEEKYSASEENHPVQKVLQQWSKSVEPLQKGLEDNVKKFQGAVDEHVKPHFDKAKAAMDENVDKHVKPHLEKAQVAVQTIHSKTAKSWEELSSSTRNLVDVHVKPGIENVKKGTTEGFETMKRGTVEGFEKSKQVLSDLPGHSKRAIDEHVLPAVENVKLGTQKTIQTVSTTSIESYQKHVQPQVEKVHKVHTTYASCYMGRAPGLFDQNETRFHMILAEASLRAFGKVVFCDNPVTGGFIWLAMLIGSPIVALCAMSSVVSLTYTAKYLDLVEPSVLRKGDIGVNSVLVGAGSAAFFHFEHPFLGWIGSLMVASIILPPITLLVYLHCTRSWMFRSTGEAPSMPTLLIPYNLVMITFLITAVLWDRTLVAPAMETETIVTPHLGQAIMNGITKVFLVQGVLSGVLVLGGTLLCSRILAGSLLVGSVVATLLGWTFGIPAVALNAGTAGYNAVLTTAALAYFFEPSWTLLVIGLFVIVLCGLLEAAVAVFFWDALYVDDIDPKSCVWHGIIIAVTRALFLTHGVVSFDNSGLPITLTVGFCFATVAILMLDTEESCSRAGVLKRVPEEELSTPEEFLAARAADAETDNLAPAGLTAEDEEEGQFADVAVQETKEDDEIPSESTPLLTKDGLDV